ncbi:hypothetical protein ACFL34_04120 [Candidatus Sumerlaeota bacterium]
MEQESLRMNRGVARGTRLPVNTGPRSAVAARAASRTDINKIYHLPATSGRSWSAMNVSGRRSCSFGEQIAIPFLRRRTHCVLDYSSWSGHEMS